MMDSVSIKPLLKAGWTTQDFIDNLETEIEVAKREIAEEKKKEQEAKKKEADLQSYREAAAAAILDWYVALGLYKEDDLSDKDIKELADRLKSAESLFTRLHFPRGSEKTITSLTRFLKDFDGLI